MSNKSLEAFKLAVAKQATIRTSSNRSTPLGKFRWAVHLVIVINSFERLRRDLEERSKQTQTIRINATFPNPEASEVNARNHTAQLRRVPHLLGVQDPLALPAIRPSSPSPSPSQSPAKLSSPSPSKLRSAVMKARLQSSTSLPSVSSRPSSSSSSSGGTTVTVAKKGHPLLSKKQTSLIHGHDDGLKSSDAVGKLNQGA
jgi:hypothetical protein